MGNTVTAALGGHRVLQPAEASLLLGVGAALVAPRPSRCSTPGSWRPFAIVAVWIGITLLVNG